MNQAVNLRPNRLRKKRKYNLITILFFVGLSISFVDIFTLSNRIDENQGALTLTSFIHYLPSFILGFVGLFTVFFENNLYNKKYKYAYVFLLLWMIFLTIRDYPKSCDIPVFFSAKGLITWIITSSLFINNKNRGKIFDKVGFIYLIILTIFSVTNALLLKVGFDRVDSQSLLRALMINLFWISAYFYLKLNAGWKSIVINFSLFTVMLLSVLSFTRSYLILAVFLMAVKSLFNKRSFRNLILLFCSIPILYLIFSQFEYFSVINYSVENLLQRFSEGDTDRASQISLFLRQINYSNFFYGAGAYSTWSSDYRDYEYLDNQWLLLLWFGGILPTILYFYLIASSFFKHVNEYIISKITFNKKYKFNIIYLYPFCWILSMSGLAIYTTFSNNFYYYFICFALGDFLKKKKMLGELKKNNII